MALIGRLALGCVRWLLILVVVVVQLAFLTWFLWAAYKIRMYPIEDFGYTIHEFDPWFNYRTTEYLAEHGRERFFKWYDYKSWYPIGRPIGTTIYPGMQFTAVGIWEAMKLAPAFTYKVPISKELKSGFKRMRSKWMKRGWRFIPPLPEKIEFAPLSVNQICCLIPAWFGSIASAFCGLVTYEVSRSVNAGIMAVGVMAFIPAHLMRSVAGEFDNEAVAMALILSTFWLWLRSVRTASSWPFSFLAALSYFGMVATWGGYIFVINMIGVHALMLVGLGRFNSGVHKAYTIFYVLGTALIVTIPVVGWTPLRSLEQIGPLGVFLGYQVLAFCDAQRRKHKMDVKEFVLFRIKCFVGLIFALVIAGMLLAPMGYFGPLTSRIRGLFVAHTKTGNPLVDSVAEHQPANQRMYASYLHLPLEYVTSGVLVCLLSRNHGTYFVGLYGYIAYHFSLKMSRLVLICGPITSIFCAVWLGFVVDFLLEPFFVLLGKPVKLEPLQKKPTNGASKPAEVAAPSNAKGKHAAKAKPSPSLSKKKAAASRTNVADFGAEWNLEDWEEEYRPGGMAQLKRMLKCVLLSSVPEDLKDNLWELRVSWNTDWKILVGRIIFSIFAMLYFRNASNLAQRTTAFLSHSDMVAQQMSNAMVKYKAGNGYDGKPIIVDDHWQGYQWMKKNTPKDARVMAWWDYGYQITGIGERTSLADGNTWNHEQIATIGKLLSSPQKKSHNVVRHLADYVMIWTGGTQDDLGISPHFARIGNSVFPDHCGDDDPICRKFGFVGSKDQPTPMMRKSLVYNLFYDGGGMKGVGADPKLFKLVYQTPRNFMRLFKVLNVSEESKEWVADPGNRICDAPGSWYCVGQYPPAIQKFINSRRSFSQVEDFNKQGEKSAYTRMIEEKKRKGGLHDDL